MKKKFIKGVCVLLMLFNLTGCVKFNVNMEINKNKSMIFSIIYALDTQYFGEHEIFTEEDINNIRNNGFNFDDYIDSSMGGVKLTKSIPNIDLVSTEDNYMEFDLSGITESNQNSFLFKIDKGVFKNKYIAKIKFDSSNNNLPTDDIPENDDELDNDVENVTENANGDAVNYNKDINGITLLENGNNITDEDISNKTDTNPEIEFNENFDISQTTANLDMSFNVTLPYSALSHNATKTNNDNKELTWTLSQNKTDYMEFQFELYNMNNIYIICGVAVVGIILLVIVVIFLIRKKKHTNNSNITNQVNEHNSNAINSITTGADDALIADNFVDSEVKTINTSMNSNFGVNNMVNSDTETQNVYPIENTTAINTDNTNNNIITNIVQENTNQQINSVQHINANNSVYYDDSSSQQFNNVNAVTNMNLSSDIKKTEPIVNSTNYNNNDNVIVSNNVPIVASNVQNINTNNNFTKGVNEQINIRSTEFSKQNSNAVVGSYIHIPGQSDTNHGSSIIQDSNEGVHFNNANPVQPPTPVKTYSIFSNINNNQNDSSN